MVAVLPGYLHQMVAPVVVALGRIHAAGHFQQVGAEYGLTLLVDEGRVQGGQEVALSDEDVVAKMTGGQTARKPNLHSVGSAGARDEESVPVSSSRRRS